MAKGKKAPAVAPAPEISEEQRVRNHEAAIRAIAAATHTSHLVDGLLSRDQEPETEDADEGEETE